MSERRDEERERREGEVRRQEERERRSDELKESWRRNHPSREEDRGRPRREERGGRALANVRCAAITRAGERCRLDATHASYCCQHSPETAQERKAHARKGGRASFYGLPRRVVGRRVS
jgi:hypothetical protein